MMLPRRMMRRIVPAEVSGHMRAANREMLLAVRSLIDKMIEKTEETPAPESPKVTRIKVE
jgi:hypothetical protein